MIILAVLTNLAWNGFVIYLYLRAKRRDNEGNRS